jgi:hypothetical protein
MNPARLVIGALLLSAIIAGAALYYLQIYAFYEEVSLTAEDVQLTSIFTGAPEPIMAENVQAIDGDSSPLKFRACFDTGLSFGLLTETYEVYEAAEPTVAPPWFDCFDAEQIGADLASGVALAFMGVENLEYGIDRVVAIYPDGTSFAWHQINTCGEAAFHRDPVPDTCPPAPERLQ